MGEWLKRVVVDISSRSGAVRLNVHRRGEAESRWWFQVSAQEGSDDGERMGEDTVRIPNLWKRRNPKVPSSKVEKTG